MAVAQSCIGTLLGNLEKGLSFPSQLWQMRVGNLFKSFYESMNSSLVENGQKIIALNEAIFANLKKALGKAIIVEGDRIEISPEKLEPNIFYIFRYVDEELVLQKLPDGKLKIFEVIEE